MIANLHLRLLGVAVLLVVCLGSPCVAAPWQVPGLIPDEDLSAPAESDPVDSAQTLFADRKISRTAESFRAELADGDTGGALAELSRLQVADPQLMVPLANGTWGPLFLNVLQDFDLLPRAAKTKLQQESSAAAKRRLLEILGRREIHLLPAFWLRYAGTEQSMQALLLMSRMQVDRGHHRSAAIWLRAVAEAGLPKYAAIARRQLKRLEEIDQSNSASAVKADSEADPTANGKPRDEQRSVFPKFASWAFRSAMSPKLELQVRAFQKSAAGNFVTPTSSWEPAFDERQVYQRTMRGLAAIDLESGQPAWHYPISPTLDQGLLKDRNHQNLFSQMLKDPQAVASFFALDKSSFANLFCRDEVQTRPVVSNGRVFLVTVDAGVKPPVATRGGFFGGPPTTAVRFRLGQLLALDAHSGRRIWTVGRATLEQHLGAGDNGVWFYGPPCVTDHWVFAVFEWKGEVRLGRFSVETGQYAASAPISIPEQTIDKDSIRTLWACTPVRNGGLLWTTTSTGWLLCLDETTLSVVWASRLANESSLRSTSSVRRGQVAALTSQLALDRRWNRSLLKLVGDRILVLSQEAHEAILLDSRTGQRVQTISVSQDVLVHVDDRVFVLSDGDDVRCFKIDDGKMVWMHDIHDLDVSGSPASGVEITGLGVVRGDYVFVPLSNGKLAKMDLQSGQVKEGDQKLLPRDGWGHLISATGHRMLYVSPDQVLHLSDSKPQKSAGNHLQLGRELLASGDVESALREARQVGEADRDFRLAQNLAFQCLLYLAESDSATYLPELKAKSKTGIQQAKRLVLETKLLLKEERKIEAISLICNLLNMPTTVIHSAVGIADVPAWNASADLDSKAIRTADEIDLTIRKWANVVLAELLSEVDSKDWPADDLQSIPRHLLLGVRSFAAEKLLTSEVSQSETRQLAFELLQRAVQLKSESDDVEAVGYQDEVRLLDEFLAGLFSNDDRDVGVPPDVLRGLLSVAIAEMPASFVDAVRTAGIYEKWSFVWPDELQEQQQRTERQWYSDWDSGEWAAVPIRSRYVYSGSQGVVDRISIGDHGDLFLNQYVWRIGAGEPARLFSSQLGSGVSSEWSLPLGVSIRSSSATSKWIYRSGTVLLLRSDQYLTAMSLMDREVLWSIPISSPSTSSGDRPFQHFMELGSGRLGTDSAPSWRIVSLGDGCVCIQEKKECHARDLLTGNVLWRFSLASKALPVVAGPNHTVLMAGGRRSTRVVNVASGQSEVVNGLAQIPGRVVHHNASEIVVWDLQESDSSRLMWVDPQQISAEKADGQSAKQRAAAASKIVSLAQFEYFQFLSTSTLAAINASGAVRVVDLENGEYQDYQVPFSKSEFPAFVRESFMAANKHFLYVGFPESSANIIRFNGSGPRVSFANELFVLDRKTGAISAKVTSEEPTALSFRDSRFPMMLVTSQPNQDERRGPLSVRCFGLDGKTQHFEGSFPFEGSVRSFDYTVNQMRSFDLMINGASFRIEAADSTAKADTSE
ncbi:MAG: PQQ-binding-like beta-propeller repeat protein [Fuerstiella sp.]